MFHGGSGNGVQFGTASSLMYDVGEENNFIVVFPNGTGPVLAPAIQTWNAGICCGRAQEDDVDDVQFTRDMIQFFGDNLCIDLNRVYASGHSNGAMMSYRLGCELSDMIAAIAPDEGLVVPSNYSCNAKMNVLHIHGTNDTRVPFYGGPTCSVFRDPNNLSAPYPVSVPDCIETWMTKDNCVDGVANYSTAPSVSYLQGANITTGGECRSFGDCDGNLEVILCLVENGGHAWFGGIPRTPPTDQCGKDHGEGVFVESFKNDKVVWEFFRSHYLGDVNATTIPSEDDTDTSEPMDDGSDADAAASIFAFLLFTTQVLHFFEAP
jgi:polyhydroxybutyrate depolymerase